MKKAIAIITIILMSLLLAPDATAQDDDGYYDTVDSLREALRTAQNNNEKAEICKEIGEESNDPDTVIKYTQLALRHIDLIDLKSMAQCYSSLGWAYFIKRDFAQSLDKYTRAAALYERTNDTETASMTYINIAACHRYSNNFKDMWDYLYRGLDKAQQTNDTVNICYAYSEIADVYQNQKMGKIAQEMLLNALKLAEQTHDYAEMGVYAKQLGSIASPEDTDIENIKIAKNWAIKAEEYFSKATYLDSYYEAQRYNNFAVITYCYLSLAKFYYDDSYIDSTRKYVTLYDHFADSISPVADNKITSLHIHARELMYQQKYRRAIDILQKCINIAKSENIEYLSNITYNLLAESYEKVGDYRNALQCLDKYCEIEQSLYGSDAVAQTIAYNARYKIECEKRNIEAENKLAIERQEEAERQKKRTFAAIITISVAAIAIIVIMLVSWLATRRAVKKIASHNIQIIKQQAMIEGQKRELQETSEKIKQSMSYARRIQMAATSSQNEIEAIFPDNIVIYRPQEIVSGDWYLAKSTERERYVAVGGSSQHGVPGAMACMLVVDTIKEITSNIPADAKVSPAEILAQVQNKVRGSIGAGVEIAISICIIDDNNLMRFAAINNDAIIVRGNTSDILNSSKREDVVVQLIEGDYLFFYSNNTRRLMSSNGNTPDAICQSLATHQSNEPQTAIETIAGNNPQSGDITIVGVRI